MPNIVGDVADRLFVVAGCVRIGIRLHVRIRNASGPCARPPRSAP